MKDNRLFRLLYYILEKGKVTASELADKFEVSVRTIYRDIDSMSSSGIPIYALRGRGGGIEIAEDFVLSKSLLSENEKQQILSALQGLEHTTIQHENELLTQLSALFKIKNTSWIEVDFRCFKLSRMKNIEVHDEKFDDSFENVILKKEIPHDNVRRIKVKFDRKVAFRVYDELSSEVMENDDGNLYTELEIVDDYNLY